MGNVFVDISMMLPMPMRKVMREGKKEKVMRKKVTRKKVMMMIVTAVKINPS